MKEWQSERGRRWVDRIEDVPGIGRRVFVGTEGVPSFELVEESYLPRLVLVDESWVAAGKRRAEAVAAEKSAAEAKQAVRTNLRGFTDGMTPLRAAKIVEALDKECSFNREFVRRRVLVESGVDAGHTVENVRGQRRFTSPDGSYFDEKQISKTAMDYAEYLTSGRREGAGTNHGRFE